MTAEQKQPTLVLRFDVESAAALHAPSDRTDAKWAEWIEESLAGVASICRVLNELKARASFFMVGELLARAGRRYAELLAGNERFNIGNHTYTHMWILGDDTGCFRDELLRTTDLIERHFAFVPIGFTAPGCFHRGLRGRAAQLKVLWEGGYRHVTTDGAAGPQAPPNSPAPFTQPYWYTDEGFPEILEVPLTGWHCNMLFNTGHQNDGWRPAPGLPDGTVVERLPRTVEEGFAIRKGELEYAIENRLVYSPCMHPWSLYRFDPELKHLRRLIEVAMDRGVPCVNCRDVYSLLAAKS